MDLYDEEAAAPVLDDEDFYAGCRELLDDEGVMAVNLFGRDASFARSSQRIVAAFGAAHVWSLQPTREGNTVVVATRALDFPAPGEAEARATQLQARFGRLGLQARKWLRMVRPVPAASR